MNKLLQKYPLGIGVVGYRSERKTAGRLGATLVKGSGANYYGMNADARLGNFALECKSTVTETMSIKREWLNKLSRAALGDNKIPAMTITFTDKTGKPKSNGSWVVIPENVFKDIANEGRHS